MSTVGEYLHGAVGRMTALDPDTASETELADKLFLIGLSHAASRTIAANHAANRLKGQTSED